jgi:uncharacterized membrane protein YcfT
LRSFPWIAGLGNEIGHKHDTIKLCTNRGFRWGWPVIDFVILHPLFGCFSHSHLLENSRALRKRLYLHMLSSILSSISNPSFRKEDMFTNLQRMFWASFSLGLGTIFSKRHFGVLLDLDGCFVCKNNVFERILSR